MKKEKHTIEQKDFSSNAIQEIKSLHRRELRLKTFRNSNKKLIERKDNENCKRDDKFLLDSFLLKSTLKCSERLKMNSERRRISPQLKLEWALKNTYKTSNCSIMKEKLRNKEKVSNLIRFDNKWKQIDEESLRKRNWERMRWFILSIELIVLRRNNGIRSTKMIQTKDRLLSKYKEKNRRDLNIETLF